jgi:hypothetical protein
MQLDPDVAACSCGKEPRESLTQLLCHDCGGLLPVISPGEGRNRETFAHDAAELRREAARVLVDDLGITPSVPPERGPRALPSRRTRDYRSTPPPGTGASDQAPVPSVQGRATNGLDGAPCLGHTSMPFTPLGISPEPCTRQSGNFDPEGLAAAHERGLLAFAVELAGIEHKRVVRDRAFAKTVRAAHPEATVDVDPSRLSDSSLVIERNGRRAVAVDIERTRKSGRSQEVVHHAARMMAADSRLSYRALESRTGISASALHRLIGRLG